MPSVLLFGPGSVGSIYAWLLSQGGCSVTLVARSNHDAIQQNGIQLKTKSWGDHTFHPAHAARSVPEAVSALKSSSSNSDNKSVCFDFVVVCSKATIPSAAGTLAPAIGPNTAIALCQNGIEIETEWAARFPENPLISGVVYLPATQLASGVVQQNPATQSLEFGTYPADAGPEAKRKCEELASLFRNGGANVDVYDDIQEMRWKKLMLNVGWNPVCALTMLDDTDFLNSSDDTLSDTTPLLPPLDFVRSLMAEIANIARKLGYDKINDSAIESILDRVLSRLKAGPAVEPSMKADVRNNRPMEVEIIVGNAVRVAKRVGVSCPVLETVYVLVRARNVAVGRK